MNAPQPFLDRLEVSDAYLAAWLLLNACTPLDCCYSPHSGPLGCLMVFSGPRIPQLHKQYLEHEARVELWEFRAASNRINQYVHEARRRYEETRRGDEGGAS